jgi:hypothetical protein
MATNKYFNHIRSAAEQTLYDNLTIENIQIAGQDFWYMPREYVQIDPILGEPTRNSFNSSYEIEGYFKDTTFFGGQGDFLAKWGVVANDVMDLIISKTRFRSLAIPGRLERPVEGDLIYYGDPLNGSNGLGSMVNSLFEITFVETEVPFWPLGKQLVYQLKCQMFSFNYEKFQTGIISVDSLNNYSVTGVQILSGGTGYATAPTVTFTTSPTGDTATGTATIANGTVTGVTITHPGSGYSVTPAVVFSTGSATAKAIIDIQSAELAHGINTEVKNREDGGLIDFTESNPFGDF